MGKMNSADFDVVFEDVNVRLVTTKGQMKKFVEYPLELYKESPYYIPLLYSDEMSLFN